MADRRVHRTRQKISHALITLILEKDYGSITIKEIIDKANVGRSTFYAHFLSKDTVLQYSMAELSNQMLEAQRASLAAPGPDGERILGFTQALHDHADRRRTLYWAIVGERSGKIVLLRLREMLAEMIRTDVAYLQRDGANPVPAEAAVQFAVGALLSTMSWWLSSESPITPHDANLMFRRLAVPALLQAAGAAPAPQLKAA